VRCRSCGEAYASRDLLELRQLEFLVEETAAWEVADALRSPYAERLEKLRTRFHRRAPPQPEAVAEAVPVAAPASGAARPEPVTAPAPRPAPPREKVPFDQWLLS